MWLRRSHIQSLCIYGGHCYSARPQSARSTSVCVRPWTCTRKVSTMQTHLFLFVSSVQLWQSPIHSGYRPNMGSLIVDYSAGVSLMWLLSLCFVPPLWETKYSWTALGKGRLHGVCNTVSGRSGRTIHETRWGNFKPPRKSGAVKRGRSRERMIDGVCSMHSFIMH